jgi:uncharacterized protein involved in copper resistance
MNNRLSRSLATLALASGVFNASAHDPAEHAREAAAAKAGPDCAQMASMDQAKMDRNDPVMQAMLARCGEAKDHEKANPSSMDHKDMDMSGMDHHSTTRPDGHGGQ